MDWYQQIAEMKLSEQPGFTEFLLLGDPWPDDLVKTINDRSRDFPRDLEL